MSYDNHKYKPARPQIERGDKFDQIIDDSRLIRMQVEKEKMIQQRKPSQFTNSISERPNKDSGKIFASGMAVMFLVYTLILLAWRTAL